jgi:pyruvate/2-oxoglutarate dehydrogenase complex dihydrolipoamide dehydrogenase (E3) component
VTSSKADIIVIGAGPAGAIAALRAADLGARTALIAHDEFGGMAANDGPVPVRTLAHAARLIRDVRQLGQYGIGVSEPTLDYSKLLARVHEVTSDVREHSSARQQSDSLGVAIHEKCGAARFITHIRSKPDVDLGRRRGRDRGPSCLDLQRVRLTNPTLRGCPAHPYD